MTRASIKYPNVTQIAPKYSNLYFLLLNHLDSAVMPYVQWYCILTHQHHVWHWLCLQPHPAPNQEVSQVTAQSSASSYRYNGREARSTWVASYSSQGPFVGRKVAGCKLKSLLPLLRSMPLGGIWAMTLRRLIVLAVYASMFPVIYPSLCKHLQVQKQTIK